MPNEVEISAIADESRTPSKLVVTRARYEVLDTNWVVDYDVMNANGNAIYQGTELFTISDVPAWPTGIEAFVDLVVARHGFSKK